MRTDPVFHRSREALIAGLACLLFGLTLASACRRGEAAAGSAGPSSSVSSAAAAPPPSTSPGPSVAPPSASVPRTATRCPPEMTLVMSGVFCIQRWEAQLFHEDGRLHDPYAVPPAPSRMGKMFARASAGVIPQGYVGRDQAELACQNAGYRLCTTDEWRLACRGVRGKRFPYGQDSRSEGLCNTHKFPDEAHLVKHFYPEAKWTTGEMTDRRVNEFPGGLARSGQYTRCTNELGVFDMVGNLQEWVSDLVSKGPHTGNSVMLGDHYMGQGKNYEGCDATNTAHPYFPDQPRKNQRDYSTGVRCCADPG